tara:strand:- start:608 stop:979 length:372 start_codon:yes stop_codon:yes gene_type:complete
MLGDKIRYGVDARMDKSNSKIYEVKIYKTNKETKKLEYINTIEQKDVLEKFDESLKKSSSHLSTRKADFKSKGKKPHPDYEVKSRPTFNTSPDKWTPDAIKNKCEVCKRTYYSTSKRNIKCCS